MVRTSRWAQLVAMPAKTLGPTDVANAIAVIWLPFVSTTCVDDRK